jgi:hypothetical protein
VKKCSHVRQSMVENKCFPPSGDGSYGLNHTSPRKRFSKFERDWLTFQFASKKKYFLGEEDYIAGYALLITRQLDNRLFD